jgi:hypothetical protein
VKRTYLNQFTTGPMPEAEELISQGWRDESWGNDSCATFVSPDETLRVWIEHPDPKQRESYGQVRFAVEAGDFNPQTHMPSFEMTMLYEGNEWSMVKTVIQENAP